METPTSISPNETEQEDWQESNLCHREMLRALPVAVFTCDALGRVNFFNRAAVRLWGCEPELNKDLWCEFWKIRKPDGTSIPLKECPMMKTIRDGRAIREEMIIECSDGIRHRVLVYTAPIHNAADAIVGTINTLVDLTFINLSSGVIDDFGAFWET